MLELNQGVCLKCGFTVAGQEMPVAVKKCGSRVKKCGSRKCGSRVKKCGCGSRNAGQLEENAVTHFRLSKMCVEVAGREMRVTSRKMRVPIAKCRGIGEFYDVPLYLCNSFVLSGIDFIFGMVLV